MTAPDMDHLIRLADILRTAKTDAPHVLIAHYSPSSLRLQRLGELLKTLSAGAGQIVVVGVTNTRLPPSPEPRELKMPVLVDSRPRKINPVTINPGNNPGHPDLLRQRQKSSVKNFFRSRGSRGR